MIYFKLGSGDSRTHFMVTGPGVQNEYPIKLATRCGGYCCAGTYTLWSLSSTIRVRRYGNAPLTKEAINEVYAF